MSQFQNLKYKYNNLNVFGKIIVINGIVFIAVLLLRLFQLSWLQTYFVLPADFWDFIVQPWSLITYAFIHADLWHLLFNMLFLFYLSRIAVNLFRPKLVLNVYFLGIIIGGILFMTIASLWPNQFLWCWRKPSWRVSWRSGTFSVCGDVHARFGDTAF